MRKFFVVYTRHTYINSHIRIPAIHSTHSFQPVAAVCLYTYTHIYCPALKVCILYCCDVGERYERTGI